MKLSIVADELSDDPATAFELGREWGVDAFELRGVGIGRVPRLEPAYERRLRNAIRDFGVTVTAVSPGLFKMSYSSEHPATGDVGLGVNWEPANSLCGGDQPYPGGYEALSGLIRNVHFKDARATPTGGEFVADGEVDWAGQIAALKRDGYAGHIAVEPHLAPSVRSVRAALDRLRSLIG